MGTRDDARPTVCRFCHVSLPHTVEEKKRHFHYVWLARLRRASPVGKPGTRVHLAGRDAALRRRRVERRTQVFYEVAPRVAERMGLAWVQDIADRFPSRLTYARYRHWIALHYGGQPSTRPYALRSIEQLRDRQPRSALARKS